jgi:hypothetical protein
MREGDHLKDPNVDGTIILNGYLGSGMWSISWIDLAQDRDRCRAFVNAVMNLQVP